MTAEERYAECKTLDDLKREYNRDIRSSETFEYLGACDEAYKKRLYELTSSE